MICSAKHTAALWLLLPLLLLGCQPPTEYSSRHAQKLPTDSFAQFAAVRLADTMQYLPKARPRFQDYGYRSLGQPSQVDFGSFQLTIQGTFEIRDSVTTDTAHLFEFPGDYIFWRLLEAQSANPTDSFAWHLLVQERMYEPYVWSDAMPLDQWQAQRVQWRGTCGWRALHDSTIRYCRIPETFSLFEKYRQRLMGLRDTFVDPGGEMAFLATLVYKDRPMVYLPPYAVLRITRFASGGQTEQRFLKIWFSYGC